MTIIFGEDNRCDLADLPSKLDFKFRKKVYRNSRGTGCLVLRESLELNPDKKSYKLITTSLHKSQWFSDVSPSLKEKFLSQTSVPNATGFVVSQDTILTAGHNLSRKINGIKERIPYSEAFFILDYMIHQDGFTDSKKIPAELVFELIPDQEDNYIDSSIADWAIVKLKTKGKIDLNKRKLNLKQEGVIDNTKLYVIGHPLGLPMKFADDSSIVNSPTGLPNFFHADLDTFYGNSGSPIFCAKEHKVVGILSGGRTDFTDVGGKQVSVSVSGEVRIAEICQRISTIYSKINP